MTDRNSRYDRLATSIKRNRLVAAVILVATSRREVSRVERVLRGRADQPGFAEDMPHLIAAQRRLRSQILERRLAH